MLFAHLLQLLATAGFLFTYGQSQGCGGGGLSVSDGKLYNIACEPVVLRGINYPLAWFRVGHNMDHGKQLEDIKKAGANAVRIVLSIGKHDGSAWARIPGKEVADMIDMANSKGLVAVIDCHDSTGWPENSAAAEPKECIEYWLSEDIKDAVQGTEDTVIVNIVNEPYGNNGVPSPHPWEAFHKDAIKQLRDAGYKHTFMIDAPNWGQDWEHIMLEKAKQVAKADPDGNTMFSVHMYEVYGDASTVNEYLNDFQKTGQAIVIGEFAADHNGKPVAEEAILEYGDEHNVGYMGWSWSGNTDPSLDMVRNFNAKQLTPWGKTFINKGLKKSGGSGLDAGEESKDESDGTKDSASGVDGTGSLDENGGSSGSGDEEEESKPEESGSGDEVSSGEDSDECDCQCTCEEDL